MIDSRTWDNSFGTWQAKWRYWGRRTSHGYQPAFRLTADRNPAFGTAALRDAELLKRCPADGLLHGGPHSVSHGTKPCIHHTLSHARVMALVQEKKARLSFLAARHRIGPMLASLQSWIPTKIAAGNWRPRTSRCSMLFTAT